MYIKISINITKSSEKTSKLKTMDLKKSPISNPTKIFKTKVSLTISHHISIAINTTLTNFIFSKLS